MNNSLETFREILEQFSEEVGGTVLWDSSPSSPPSVSVEWFQKNIQRGMSIAVHEKTYTLTAYASTVKKGATYSRKKLLEDIPRDRDFMEILEEGKALSLSLMEKTFELTAGSPPLKETL